MNFWDREQIPEHLKQYFEPAPEIGQEQSPEEYVAKLVDVFREVRRVLRDDGTLWLNLGDSYASAGGAHGGRKDNQRGVGAKKAHDAGCGDQEQRRPPNGLKPKDLIGIPWRAALALQQDGWWLRQDIIWHKTNPMPESVRDRCVKAHEYIFLLSKSQRYYFDHKAIKEPAVSSKPAGNKKHKYTDSTGIVPGGGKMGIAGGLVKLAGVKWETRNKRSVWPVGFKPYKEAHFATYPPELITPCVLAGCPPGGVVLDPFLGSGTTAMVARDNGRDAVGIELNPEYLELAKKRLQLDKAA